MSGRLRDHEVANRLPYLLIFRAGVASLLLLIYLAAGLGSRASDSLSQWLYAVIVATFAVVLVLGALLRRDDSNPIVLAVAHLASTVMSTMFIVQLTGGIDTPFSFLYLLAILDGAIIGGRSISLVVATFSTLAFGAQLAMQRYGLWLPPLDVELTSIQYLRAFGTHALSFYAMAALSGYLAQLIQTARAEMSSVQAAFDRAEKQQREVLASLPVGVLTLTSEHEVVSANPSAQKILNWAPRVGEVAPRAIRAFLESGRRDGEVSHRDRVLGVTRSETTGVSSWSSGLLVILVIEDRTELRVLERDVRQNERLASLGAISAAMAHEIRNPLAALSGAIELIFADPDDRGTYVRLESVVHREIHRLNKLISEFLAYARPTEPQKQVLALETLVRDVCVMAEQDDRARGHPIVFDFEARPRVMADPEQMRQVLWNLLLNAFDASPLDAEVSIRIERDSEFWRIDIRDHGRGIDPEIRDVLYEPFRTTKSGGTGLGLALVHRIVDSHDGRVQLQDAEDGGVVASVWLKAHEQEPLAAPSWGDEKQEPAWRRY